jgi:hypothetical protein
MHFAALPSLCNLDRYSPIVPGSYHYGRGDPALAEVLTEVACRARLPQCSAVAGLELLASTSRADQLARAGT